MGLFFNKVKMSAEEQAVHNEVKANLDTFNAHFNGFENWRRNNSNESSNYKKVLTIRELDQEILEKTKLGQAVDALDFEFSSLVAQAQPFINFKNRLNDSNIKLNNMNFNEKKLLQEPLRQNVEIIKTFSVLKEQFNARAENIYNSIIGFFDSDDITNIKLYALKRMSMENSDKNDIVTKVKYIDNVFQFGMAIMQVCEENFGFIPDDDSESLRPRLIKLIDLYDLVESKFPYNKSDDSFFSTVDKKLKSSKKMFYYLNILDELPNCLDALHEVCIEYFYGHTTYKNRDKSANLQELDLSLKEAMALIGVSPEYVSKRINSREAIYGGQAIKIKEIMIGKSLFTEVNGLLSSIEHYEDYEMDLEEEFAADTLGYEL